MKKITKRRLIQINDDLFSLIIRTRDNFVCQKCLQDKGDKAKPNKHNNAHHIIGRENKAVRWDIDNGVTLDYYHHKNWLVKASREDIDKFYESITDYDELKLRAKRIIKFNLEFCKEEFVKLAGYFTQVELAQVVPKYIIKELLEVKND